MQSSTPTPPAPARKVLFVTDRLKGKVSASDLTNSDDLDDWPHEADSDQRPPFAQSSIAGFEIPKEFTGDSLKSDMFRLAVHETGHALANLLFAGRVDAIVMTEIEGGGCGRSFGWGGHGMDGARVSLAGLAAERLIAGTPLPLDGFKIDVEAAKKDLRDAGISEDSIDWKLQWTYTQVQRLFAKNWTRSIVEVATALTKRGLLDGKELFAIISRAQENADEAGGATFTKSLQDVQIGTGTGTPHIDRVTFPGADVSNFTTALDLLAKAHQFNQAADEPGLTALEVSRREAMRNRAESHANELGAK